VNRLDTKTIEVIAKLICGSEHIPGRVTYNTPSHNRSIQDIKNFFNNAGCDIERQQFDDHTYGSKFRWVENKLNYLNNNYQGNIISEPTESLILRLVDPKEYPGKPDVRNNVEDYLNRVLITEGLKVSLKGLNPSLEPA